MERSLYQVNPRHFEIPIFLGISFVTLILGLFLPIITLKELVFWKTTFSVLTGIISLMDEKHYILGLIILVFSVFFPLIKLVTLSALWFFPLSDVQRINYIKWLNIFGKWSMLDVFIVAITIVITKISKLASAEPRIGIYFFGLSIVLAMLITMRIEKLLPKVFKGKL